MKNNNIIPEMESVDNVAPFLSDQGYWTRRDLLTGCCILLL